MADAAEVEGNYLAQTLLKVREEAEGDFLAQKLRNVRKEEE
jgi:hypothetical protein